MYFKRKVYDKLLEWKNNYAGKYAVLLEGARRVGKSTIAKTVAENEYKSYILIDFSNTSEEIKSCFDDISQLNMFFLRLQALTQVDLYPNESVIIFDEVQLFPRARQAIKHLVKDGRYHYIETGSLISIKKNVKDILIPSEEMKIQVYPMDYKEFLDATGGQYHLLQEIYDMKQPIGQSINRKLMRDLRVYMAVGGMPQAVEAYISGMNFSQIDCIKREIINSYEKEFKKIDPTGKLFKIYKGIPSQISRDVRKYHLATSLEKRPTGKEEELIYDLIDSKTVLSCYNSIDPQVSLTLSKDLDSYKLYLADTGLFVTLMFIDKPVTENDVYAKLLSDKLPANLGYLYENLVAQIIASKDRELFYHTWDKKGSTHYYEIDFLIRNQSKISPIEVKSSGTGKHESLDIFYKKHSKTMSEAYICSQKDYEKKEYLTYLPLYLVPFL